MKTRAAEIFVMLSAATLILFGLVPLIRIRHADYRRYSGVHWE
jgi:hypothetical protein